MELFVPLGKSSNDPGRPVLTSAGSSVSNLVFRQRHLDGRMFFAIDIALGQLMTCHVLLMVLGFLGLKMILWMFPDGILRIVLDASEVSAATRIIPERYHIPDHRRVGLSMFESREHWLTHPNHACVFCCSFIKRKTFLVFSPIIWHSMCEI